MTGTTSPMSYKTLKKQKAKALCLPQLVTNLGVEKSREAVSWVHFSWWTFDDWQRRSVSEHLMNSDTKDYFQAMCRSPELKKKMEEDFLHMAQK